MNNTDKQVTELPWTGERYLPSIQGGVELEHFHRYLFAEQLVKGKCILDIASGEGYGSALMARSAASVVGVDISEDAVIHAREKYRADNLEYRVGSCAAIPLEDHSVDVIVSFETIEHHDQHEEMMREIKRVLKPEGVLLISCPDKLEYSDKPGYKNEYHVKELYREEFVQLLADHFKKHVMFGQRAAYGSLILQEEGLYENVTARIDDKFAPPVKGLANAVYLIAIASDVHLPAVQVGLLDQDLKSISEISERDVWIATLNETIHSLILDRDSQKAGYEQLQEELKNLRATNFKHLADLKSLHEREIAERDAQIANLSAVTQSVERDQPKTDEIAALKLELLALRQSTSWRVTSPMRKAVKLSRSLFGGQMKEIHGDSEESSARPVNVVSTLNLRGKRTPESEPRSPALLSDKYRVLLTSFYCPTRAHAGGLRILDMYALLREKCPDARIDLFTCSRPGIDWSLDDANAIFDNIYLTNSDDLDPEELRLLQGGVSLRYDLVDLQFHQTARRMDAFRAIGSKVIFTPMESLAKAFYLELVTMFRRGKLHGIKRLAGGLQAALEEISFCRKADETVCVSETDASFLRRVGGSRKVRSIETGISKIEFGDALNPSFVPAQAASKNEKLIYVAYFGSQTNIDALDWYLEHVHPLVKKSVPGYKLSVVGRGDMAQFKKYEDASLELVGEVPEIGPHISDARVGIAPGLGGSGFRGKVNQYAVLGVPCVVSPVTLQGLAYRNGENVCVAESPADFARDCIRLLTDLEYNQRMATAARELAIEHYSWQSKWPQISSVYVVKGAV
jgi:ubiquinone/menaquinone biosynthesis C-methylase UbiE/glycosyltransferase involved in cell wall biosynthesis